MNVFAIKRPLFSKTNIQYILVRDTRIMTEFCSSTRKNLINTVGLIEGYKWEVTLELVPEG